MENYGKKTSQLAYLTINHDVTVDPEMVIDE